MGGAAFFDDASLCEVTSTDVEDGDVPTPLRLHQNIPNPFNPSTMISFDLPHDAHVKLDVYNVKGELVANVLDEKMSGGHKRINWTAVDAAGKPLSSGVYFYRLFADEQAQTRKMVLLR